MKYTFVLALALLVLPAAAIKGWEGGSVSKSYASRSAAYERPVCDPSVPEGDRPRAMARAQCMVDEMNKDFAGSQDSDLVALLATTRMVLAEKYRDGAISKAEADAAFSAKVAEVIGQAESRQMAKSAALRDTYRTFARPTVRCTSIGYSTTCY